MTSTERLNASAKAIASHKEARTIRALIIMIKLNKATITVRAFLSEKYFLIIFNLQGPGGCFKINTEGLSELIDFGRTGIYID